MGKKVLKVFLMIVACIAVFIISTLITITFLVIIGYSVAPRMEVPAGYYNKDEYFEKDSFQDYTDYCKYYYKEGEKLFEEAEKYTRVSKQDLEKLKERFVDFENAMEACRPEITYDFKLEQITIGDYVYIEKDRKDSYTLYLFDAESNVLYYIHHNI